MPMKNPCSMVLVGPEKYFTKSTFYDIASPWKQFLKNPH